MVYNFALRNKLTGYVSNSGDGLHIEINTDKESIWNIINDLIKEAPSHCHIRDIEYYKTTFKPYHSFEIKDSENNNHVDTPLTPDYALCSLCKEEMNDETNRRYQYPFITCTQCGPRYSIIHTLPYDRENTSMNAFEMCDDCRHEYENINERRYFSQTNSCNNCGIQLTVFDKEKNKYCQGNKNSLQTIDHFLKDGKILAIKSVGGFLLICDASNENAIHNLRKRKHRKAKPFALLCNGIDQVKKIADCSEEEALLLKTTIAPIVLLKSKNEASSVIAVNAIAPGLNTLGIMLPSAPLLEIIVSKFDRPLVATSGNISGEAIIYKNENAIEHLRHIADYIVIHNREILTPQDDAVVRICLLSKKQIIIRRSRGLSPSHFFYSPKNKKNVFATGALMKSSFTITNKQNIYISQYLGSTDAFDAQLTYQETAEHLLSLTDTIPELVITDKHPDYFSSEFGKELANKFDADLITVQHHKAHFAAALAENNLLDSKEKVLGVIWDGTGLGDDKNIWGGEFFTYCDNRMERSCHFDYFPMLLGDKISKEPRLAALSICSDFLECREILQKKFSPEEWKLYNRLLQQDQLLQTSSCGRIFDTIASLLGICDKQTYEGEAAMLLESLAQEYFSANGYDLCKSYFTEIAHYDYLPTTVLFSGIIKDILNGENNKFIAAKFHYSLVHAIKMIADHLHAKKIAFSGGVFQNALLVDLLHLHLTNDHELFFHKHLSPNDENISFGQMVYVDN
jgi:hydrogenase maturation protein HypF